MTDNGKYKSHQMVAHLKDKGFFVSLFVKIGDSQTIRSRCFSGAACRERHLDRCFEGRKPVSWRGRF